MELRPIMIQQPESHFDTLRLSPIEPTWDEGACRRLAATRSGQLGTIPASVRKTGIHFPTDRPQSPFSNIEMSPIAPCLTGIRRASDGLRRQPPTPRLLKTHRLLAENATPVKSRPLAFLLLGQDQHVHVSKAKK